MELQRVGEADLAEVSAFLCSTFGLTEPTRNFQLDVLRWKYLAPHPYWDGSRSYCLRVKGRIAAHGCVVPSRLLVGDRSIRSCGVIDWASSPKVVGAGTLIYQLLYPETEVFLAIGGSQSAREIIPNLGFVSMGDLNIFTRVVRPVQDFRKRPLLNWRSSAHLARNTIRLVQRRGALVPAGWSARRVHRFDKQTVFPQPGETGTVVSQHSPELLNYLLACPAAQVEGYAFYSGGSVMGYCLLSWREGRCHIAHVESGNLTGAYALALQLATRPQGVSEVIATASTPSIRSALTAAGFCRREAVPVLARDPQGLLCGLRELSITSLEDDYFYR